MYIFQDLKFTTGKFWASSIVSQTTTTLAVGECPKRHSHRPRGHSRSPEGTTVPDRVPVGEDAPFSDTDPLTAINIIYVTV